MKQTLAAIKVIIVFTALTGIVYPLAMTGLAKIVFADKAEGSMLFTNGRPAGSALIGQEFTGRKYFHGRPSASSYDALRSGASNYGPSNPAFIKAAAQRAAAFRIENSVFPSQAVPAAMVLASASGLDPHIDLDSALMQAPRIAKERGLKETAIAAIVNRLAEKRYFDLFGTPMVNVLKLNIALDAEK